MPGVSGAIVAYRSLIPGMSTIWPHRTLMTLIEYYGYGYGNRGNGVVMNMSVVTMVTVW